MNGVISLSRGLLSYSNAALCVSTCIGYRWTLRLGLVLFAVPCVLLPFSSQITGPIPNTSVLNASSLVYSGSGSGSESQNSTTFDYCGNDFSEEIVSVNSYYYVAMSPYNFKCMSIQIQ